MTNSPTDEILLQCDEKGMLQQKLMVYMVSGVAWNISLGAEVTRDRNCNLRIAQAYNADNPHPELAKKTQVLVLKAKYIEAVAYTQ